jgi:hypothetical protein
MVGWLDNMVYGMFMVMTMDEQGVLGRCLLYISSSIVRIHQVKSFFPPAARLRDEH